MKLGAAMTHAAAQLIAYSACCVGRGFYFQSENKINGML